MTRAMTTTSGAGRPAVPAEVRRLAEARTVRIRWTDGHVSAYPFAYLRGWCPCAACQGHGNAPHFVEAENTDLAHVAVVGKYALGLTWGDGHDTGIYSYRWLRQLCRCAACAVDATPPA